MIALSRIAGENASFAQHLSQQGFEGAHFIVLLGNRALLHHDARLGLIHMQYLLLRLFSSVQLLARASQGFPINGQMDMLLT